jgi:hypothetical protein
MKEIYMYILTFVAILILIIGLVIIFRQISPSTSLLVISDNSNHFPEVSGYNLDRKEFEFPRDFAGKHNLVIIAFQQNHQALVNTWLPFAQQLEEDIPGFVYYELPTIKEMSALSRTFINEGMRAGIPDQTARERTITLYLNKEEFKTTLNIPNENDIYLLLVEVDGSIVWRTKGSYSQEKADQLSELLERLVN